MDLSFAEKFQHFVSQLFSSIGTVLKVILRSKLRIQLPSIKNERLIIMGNGPSMKEVIHKHAEQLVGKNLWAVNYFGNSDLFELVKPNYYLIVGPEFWREGVREQNIRLRKILFDNFISKTKWSMQIFLPAEAFKSAFLKEYLDKNEHLSFHPFNTTPVEGFDFLTHSFYRFNLGMPRPHNVIIPSLMVALNLGFKNIFLTGVEHSWLPTISVNDNNEVLHLNKHFYDPSDLKNHKMYLLGIRPRRLHEVLHKLMLAFKGYFTIRDYAETMDAKIHNTTPKSFIDAFERSNFEEALK